MGGLIMKIRYTVALSMIAGVGLGAAAIQGLHAQATPKALLVTESEIVDRAKVPPYSSVLTSAMQVAGGQWAGGGTGPSEKVTSIVVNAPKRLGVMIFDNADKAQA